MYCPKNPIFIDFLLIDLINSGVFKPSVTVVFSVGKYQANRMKTFISLLISNKIRVRSTLSQN